jgi:hypothetical protein
MAVLHSLHCYGDVPPPLVTGHCALAVRRQSVDPLRRVAALFNAAMSVGVSVAVSPESVGLGTAGLLGCWAAGRVRWTCRSFVSWLMSSCVPLT